MIVADIRDAAAVRRGHRRRRRRLPLRRRGAARPRSGRPAIGQRRRHGDAAARVPRRRRRQGRPPLVERRVRHPRVEPGAARHGAPARSSRTARPSSPPSGRACTPPPTASTSRSCDRARSSDTAASASSPCCSTGSPTAPTRSCSATAPTATSSSTPTTSRRCASRAAGRTGPAIYNAGTDRFGTMREAIEHVCAHAGTGARVRSLPVRPAAAAMRADGATRPHPVRAVPLADVRAVDVVRHRPRPRRARLAAALLQRRDARRELRLVRRQPRRSAPGGDPRRPIAARPSSRLLSLLKRICAR